jgi:protoporphyrinogen oxidase
MDYATIKKLGLSRTFQIGLSYIHAKLFPIKSEKNLEDFFCNRFGKKLYETFFKDYTEKVWGIPCDRIPSSWGVQRVKDLNISRLLLHAFMSLFRSDKSINQEKTSTSLIEQFLYPKYGPGQMWETVAEEIKRLGGKFYFNTALNELVCDNGYISSAQIKNNIDNSLQQINAAYFFSTMPIKELIEKMKNCGIDDSIKNISSGLQYRDFLIVGILASRLNVKEGTNDAIKDNWIYIQDKGVKAGRLQIFNNWSPFMVNDAENTWMGVEYFCNEGDSFWGMSDDEIIKLAISEMEQIKIINASDVKDAMVARVLKAYPSYYGSYEDFDIVKHFLNSIQNLYPIGRNGMHRYNNSDHSMLTAMAAVDNIISGQKSKENIWEINTEDEYHEEKK